MKTRLSVNILLLTNVAATPHRLPHGGVISLTSFVKAHLPGIYHGPVSNPIKYNLRDRFPPFTQEFMRESVEFVGIIYNIEK